MEFEIGYVNSMMDRLHSSGQSISGAFESSWNDDVHDSFGEFVHLFEGEARSLLELVNTIPSILSPLAAVDAKKFNSQVDELLKQIEGI